MVLILFLPVMFVKIEISKIAVDTDYLFVVAEEKKWLVGTAAVVVEVVD